MRSIRLAVPTAVTAMLVFALIAPVADAGASPKSTVTAAKKKPSCKRNARRRALNRGPARASAGIARRARKCKSGYRTYRGKTSQGERIELKTRTTEYGTKLVSGKIRLSFFARHVCSSSNGQYSSSEEYNDQNYPRLSGTARLATFKTKIPAFDAEYRYLASVAGKVTVAHASGQVSTEAGGIGGDTQCAAASFTFDIPRIRGGGGF
jgi:hypothetical protein